MKPMYPLNSAKKKAFQERFHKKNHNNFWKFLECHRRDFFVRIRMRLTRPHESA